MRVHQPHRDPCVASERAVHRIVRQNFAVDPVPRDTGDRADDVGGVDVFDVRPFDSRAQLVPHPGPYVRQDRVSALVKLTTLVMQQILRTSR